MNRPKGDSIDVDSLHFEGNIVGEERDSFNARGESNNRIPGANDGFEADSSFDKMTVSNDDKPLIGFGLLPEIWYEIYQSFKKPIKKCKKSEGNEKQNDIFEIGNDISRWASE